MCTAAARCLNSWQNLQEEMQLQEAARHILTFVEMELAYGAVHVNVQNLKKVTYQTTSGNKQITLYCDNAGLYQRTTTGSGTGTNPASLEDITMKPWEIKKISDRAVSINMTLCASKRTRNFQRIIYCYNGEVVEDE